MVKCVPLCCILGVMWINIIIYRSVKFEFVVNYSEILNLSINIALLYTSNSIIHSIHNTIYVYYWYSTGFIVTVSVACACRSRDTIKN